MQKHGWNYEGKEGWRTATIFNTNMRSAFSAGNEAQLQRTKSRRPFARYIAGLSAEPRQEHLAWHNIILPIDHSWWSSHTPPNGWGCKCRKVSVSSRELKRNNWQVSEKPPTPASSTKGIDPSFNFNPGRAAWGQQLALDSMRGYKENKTKFEVLSTGDWKSEGLPDRLNLSVLKAKSDFSIPQTKDGMEAALKNILEGDEKIFSLKQGEFRYDFNVNAIALAEHLETNVKRASLLPFLPEVLESPTEVWQTFERHRKSGKVVLRTRFLKAVDTGKKGEGFLFVSDASNGQMEGLTFIPYDRLSQLNNERRGKLIFREGK